MTGLDQACADLTAWLPAAEVLITEQDTIPGSSDQAKAGWHQGASPHSTPPWNAAIAMAILDIHAAVRALEHDLRTVVTGSTYTRGGSNANTLKAITAIRNLAQAADAETEVAAMLERLLTPILQHPAIDLEEPPQRPEAPCPRCTRKMLRFYPRSLRLACLGCQRKACVVTGGVSGEPMLEWDDGEITIAPEGTTT